MVPTGVLPEPLRNEKQNKYIDKKNKINPKNTTLNVILYIIFIDRRYTSQPGPQPTPL